MIYDRIQRLTPPLAHSLPNIIDSQSVWAGLSGSFARKEKPPHDLRAESFERAPP